VGTSVGHDTIINAPHNVANCCRETYYRHWTLHTIFRCHSWRWNDDPSRASLDRCRYRALRLRAPLHFAPQRQTVSTLSGVRRRRRQNQGKAYKTGYNKGSNDAKDYKDEVAARRERKKMDTKQKRRGRTAVENTDISPSDPRYFDDLKMEGT